MRNRYLVLTLAALAGMAGVNARQLTPAEALARATATESTLNTVQSVTAVPTLCYTASRDGMNTLYVFNRADNGGFLIVPADDGITATVLGYADGGTFTSAESMPDNVRWWLDQYSGEIAMSLSGNTERVQEEGEITDTLQAVEPIVKTRWNQLAPYNDMCPELNGRHCPTGCVATTMAQMMNVHQWPENGIGSHAYKPIAIGRMITADFAATTYRWDKMLDVYTQSSPQENIDAVATLMYSCGVSVNMQYNSNASGANYESAAKALVKYFDYDKGIRVLVRGCYGYEEWVAMIHNELMNGRPVMYAGSNDEASHAFVCDGYRGNGYIHINWGWGGLSDGYFLLTALDPNEQGTGGSSAGYNIGQQLILGIQKPQEGSVVIPVMRFISNFGTSVKRYHRPYGEVRFTDRRGIFNESVDSVDATMGVKLTDINGNVTYAESTQKKYLAGQGFTTFVVPVERFPDSGEYVVTPAVKDQNGKWWDCEVDMANIRSLNLRVMKDSLVFSATEEPIVKATDLNLLSPVYPGRQFGLRALLTNKGDMEFYDQVMPILEADDAEKGMATPIAVDLLEGESDTFEWVGEFPSSVTPGEYTLYLVDSHGVDLSEGIPVTVETAPAEAAAYEILSTTADGVAGTETSPAQMNPAEFRVKVDVDCSAGYFTGIMEGGVFHADGTGIYAIAGGYIGVPAGEHKSIEMGYDLSPYLSAGNLYYFIASCSPYGRIGNKMYFTTGTQGIELIGADNGAVRVIYSAGSPEVIVEAPDMITEVTVYSLTGILAGRLAGTGENSMTVDVSGFAPGLYLLRVAIADGSVSVARIAVGR